MFQNSCTDPTNFKLWEPQKLSCGVGDFSLTPSSSGFTNFQPISQQSSVNFDLRLPELTMPSFGSSLSSNTQIPSFMSKQEPSFHLGDFKLPTPDFSLSGISMPTVLPIPSENNKPLLFSQKLESFKVAPRTTTTEENYLRDFSVTALDSTIFKDSVPNLGKVATGLGLLASGMNFVENYKEAVDSGKSPVEAVACEGLKTVTKSGLNAVTTGAIISGGLAYTSFAAEQFMMGNPLPAATLPVAGPVLFQAYSLAESGSSEAANLLKEGCYKSFDVARGLSNGTVSTSDLAKDIKELGNNALGLAISTCAKVPGCPQVVAPLVIPSLIIGTALSNSQESLLKGPKP